MIGPAPSDEDDRAGCLSLPADLREEDRLRAWIASRGARCGLSEGGLFDLAVCVHEAFCNAAIHGAGSSGRPVTFSARMWREAGNVVLEMEDDGIPFDPREVPAPVRPNSLEEAKIGGLGVDLMRRLSDGMSYQRVDGRNRLTLSRRLDRDR